MLIVLVFILLTVGLVWLVSQGKQAKILQISPTGNYYCNGCSKNYDHTFARWESSTDDCEGVVEGSQLYTPSCGCSAPGASLYPGNAADMCSPSKVPPFVCSGCAWYKSSLRTFATWLSRYPDCSDKLQDPTHGINPVYTLNPPDQYCNRYAGQRPTPTPSPMPTEDFCSLSVANNPCYITYLTTTGVGKCTTKIDWISNRDIKIYFQTKGLRLTQTQAPETLPVPSDKLILIDGSYYYWLAKSGQGTNSKWQQISVKDSPVKFAGVINGVAKCRAEASAVQLSSPPPIPTLPSTLPSPRSTSGH